MFDIKNGSWGELNRSKITGRFAFLHSKNPYTVFALSYGRQSRHTTLSLKKQTFPLLNSNMPSNTFKSNKQSQQIKLFVERVAQRRKNWLALQARRYDSGFRDRTINSIRFES